MQCKTLFGLVIFLVTGCTGFTQAFDSGLHSITGEPEFIHLSCNEPLGKSEKVSEQGKGLVVIGEIRDSRPIKEYIGGMFNRPTIPLPITAGGTMFIAPVPLKRNSINLQLDEQLEEVLLSDVRAILKANGYIIEKKTHGNMSPPASLTIEILEAWVESYPGKWSDPKGYLVGIIAFKLAMAETKTDQILWAKDFSGVEVTRVNYTSKSNHEETLTRAYCKALASFNEFINARVTDGAAQDQ